MKAMNSLDLLRLTIREVFVYALPALRSHEGYKAEDWNLEKPIITGVLQIYQSEPYREEEREGSGGKEDDEFDDTTKERFTENSNEKSISHLHEKLSIRILEPTSKEVSYLSAINQENFRLFAECPISMDPQPTKGHKEGKRYKPPPLESFVDTVTDSSRYFVIRCQDQHSNKSALLGIGFREREKALDFKATIQDYIQYMNRQSANRKEPDIITSKTASTNSGTVHDRYDPSQSSENLDQPKNIDLSLKEGEKIQINLKGLRIKNNKDSMPTKPNSQVPLSKANTSSSSTESNGKSLLLPPPPTRQEKHHKIEKDKNSIDKNIIKDSNVITEEVDDEFGDFEAAL